MRPFVYVTIGVALGWWAIGWGIWMLRRRWYVMAAGAFAVGAMNLAIWAAATVGAK